MTDPAEDNSKNGETQQKSKMRKFEEAKINGVVVRGDKDAPCDGEFEWMPDNGD